MNLGATLDIYPRWKGPSGVDDSIQVLRVIHQHTELAGDW
jgi:hypothetical protein